MSEMLLEQEAVDDSSSSDSSMEGVVITLDQDLSFLIDVKDKEDDDDEEDAISIDVVSAAVQETIAYSNHIFCPLSDKRIDFAAPPLIFIDLDESKCILDFRFRKLELLEIANLLWPKMELFLEGHAIKSSSRTGTHTTMKLVCCLSFLPITPTLSLSRYGGLL